MRIPIDRLPFSVQMGGIGAVAMFVPAIHAYTERDLQIARTFFYSGILFLTFFALLGVALGTRSGRQQARGHLIAMVLALTVLPIMLAVPFHQSVGHVRFLNAWFEMISSITTTGATLYDGMDRIPDTLHLWRAIVGWLGGLLIWVSAVAILAPLNLGGFEVLSSREVGAGNNATQITRVANPSERLARFTQQLLPIYVGLTLLLWVLLVVLGQRPLYAAATAMSTLSTSGITIGPAGRPPWTAEPAIFVFLFFAISRLTFSRDGGDPANQKLSRDPEVQMGLVCVALLPTFLFLRHWMGAYDVNEVEDLGAGLKALWGATFTTLSFLTTTGFQSTAWVDARSWSGLETPGLVLAGLALIGGGVATTAGGVKLLRIYALYKHGLREMDKLVHPNSVGGAGSVARRIRRQGAFVAWIFFMLFALSVALVMGALALAGLDFESATVLTIAALSTTGPLAEVVGEAPILYSGLSDPARIILAGAMVLGRLETLALIALFNPAFWRS
ncbi:TrkH family potassium uptake protein [Profundibacterium mesophilum]|uniref:Potassium uptake transporter transmembrane subunit TrkH n=1 Tax=Profundibacterium mesophilum KAUST100406-0324 TaxID=1037889 RepID=A0A921NT60_9RHOB|nr:potassium transporter TrkG [Profundibacterium mesophilum]KAF0677492.1 Potassium uptake transporter transmembrane subunit TrkH [Profundibacterium mesophilum KAUST100406-0324]